MKKNEYHKEINMYYWRHKNYPNLGDELARIIIEKKHNTTVNLTSFYRADSIAVGSILENALNRVNEAKGINVFGVGFMNPPKEKLKNKAELNIISVRGELTRKILIDNGYDIKYIGDVGLIVDELIDAKGVDKKYQVSLIPHHLYFEHYKKIVKENNLDFNLIDLRTTDYKHVLSEIASSHYVVSQSLHGLIMSDSLGVKNTWLNKETLHSGNGFKFYDYFSSINRSNDKFVSSILSYDDIIENSHFQFDDVEKAKKDVREWVNIAAKSKRNGISKLNPEDISLDDIVGDYEVNYVRDLAVAYENNNLALSYRLMTMANSKRADPFIKKKVREYEMLMKKNKSMIHVVKSFISKFKWK